MIEVPYNDSFELTRKLNSFNDGKPNLKEIEPSQDDDISLKYIT